MGLKNIFTLLVLTISFQCWATDFETEIKQADLVYNSNPDSSFYLYTQLEKKLVAENADKDKIYKVKTNILKYLILKARFDEAIEILQTVIPYYEKTNNFNELGYCSSLRSVIGTKINDVENAIKYANIAYNYYVKADNIDGQIRVLTNLSHAYNSFNLFDSAYVTLNKLFGYETKMTNNSKYYLYQNFGNYYSKTNKNINAIINYQKALKLAEEENMTDSRATILMLIAEAYINLKEYTSAERFLNQSIALSKKHHLIFELNEAYDQLIIMYEQKGDYKNAFLTKKINDEIKNEIFNLEKINKINEYESQIQLTEKEKLIAEKDLSLKKEQLINVEAKSKITTLLFVIIICVLLVIFVFVIFFRVKKLNSEIKLQKTIVEEKNKEITSSITYAKRIQNAILPPESAFESYLPQSFIFYLPKDIVAGDFYWLEKINNEELSMVSSENSPLTTQLPQQILFAAADCTGHGVPGAMVSVVCNNALNRAVREFNLTKPAAILDKVSLLVEETFEKSVNEVRDGMDITLCNFNPKTLQLEYAGANNSLYLIRNNELIEIKGDRQPIGNYFKKKPFTSHQLQLQKNDTIYLFTDGFADQFGGSKGKKFMYKPFKELLLTISRYPMQEQSVFLNKHFTEWKGNYEQVDDVCVIGVKI
ncbi:MAG: SpoIIE family protein phosphatase [Flavobacteriales bacterium]|nr:SpoIIE family protein phosphatase [Flavobacteriales bacterium]